MQTAFLTGGTGGIGTATATELARRGYHVLYGARTNASGETRASLVRAKVPGAEVDVIAGDLSTLDSARTVATRVIETGDPLDALLVNAGVAMGYHSQTADGIDMEFAVNALMPIALTMALLPQLRVGNRARVVYTGTSDHLAIRKLDFDALVKGDPFHYTQNYAGTKLLGMAGMLELGRRAGITVNIADPGWTRTGLTRSASLPFRTMVRVARPLQNTAADSANVLVDLVADDVGTGQFLGRKGASNQSELFANQSFRSAMFERLVAVLEQIGGGDLLHELDTRAN